VQEDVSIPTANAAMFGAALKRKTDDDAEPTKKRKRKAKKTAPRPVVASRNSSSESSDEDADEVAANQPSIAAISVPDATHDASTPVIAAADSLQSTAVSTVKVPISSNKVRIAFIVLTQGILCSCEPKRKHSRSPLKVAGCRRGTGHHGGHCRQ
jgi:hypothetical protein